MEVPPLCILPVGHGEQGRSCVPPLEPLKALGRDGLCEAFMLERHSLELWAVLWGRFLTGKR